MNDIIKIYELFLFNLNSQIENWNFDLKKNKNFVNQILKIYFESKNKNFKKVNLIMTNVKNELEQKWYIEEIKNTKIQKFRDWDIEYNEENLETLNWIEMISSIFLKNLQNELWQNK